MNNKGNATVELAIIFPLIIYIIFIVIHLAIIIYQKAYIKSLCNDILNKAALNFYNQGSDFETGEISLLDLKTDNIYISLYDKEESVKIDRIKDKIQEKLIFNGIIRPIRISQEIEIKNILLYKRLESNIIIEYESPISGILDILGFNGNYKIEVSNNSLIRDYKNYVNNVDYAFEIYHIAKDKIEILKKISDGIDEIKMRLIY